MTTPPTRPLSYDASKCVIQYLSVDQRLNIRLHCPTLQTSESIVPLKIKKLEMNTYFVRADQIEYEFSNNTFSYNEAARQYGCNQINIINHTRRTMDTMDLKSRCDLEDIRSFVMHKLLGGRRFPVIIDNIELKGNSLSAYDMEENLQFPKDLKMKVRHLGVHWLDEQVLQQLSSHITGGSLRSFRVLTIDNNTIPASQCALIRNAQKLECSIRAVLGLSLNALSLFTQKEIIVDNDGFDVHSTLYLNAMQRMIVNRQQSNIESWTNMTFNATRKVIKKILGLLRRDPQARRAVVDDVESNQKGNERRKNPRLDVPCVSLPMDLDMELNVYGIRSKVTGTDLRMRVMPKGSARKIE